MTDGITVRPSVLSLHPMITIGKQEREQGEPMEGGGRPTHGFLKPSPEQLSMTNLRAGGDGKGDGWRMDGG